MRARGLSLPAVLIIATLAALAAFTLAAVTQSHLSQARRSTALQTDAYYVCCESG